MIQYRFQWPSVRRPKGSRPKGGPEPARPPSKSATASCYEWMHHMLRYLQPQVVLFKIYGLKNYLSVHILQSRTFKCSLSNHRKAVYRSTNAIFGKIGLIVSEDLVLQLIKSTCISSLLYGVDAYALTKSVYVYYRLPDWLIDSSCAWILNKLCGRPPQYAPAAPASWPLTFWPWK